jgi:hypothetical protein
MSPLTPRTGLISQLTLIRAGALPVSPGLSGFNELSAIEFVQDKPKSETVKKKVKRIWRNLTAYKFEGTNHTAF